MKTLIFIVVAILGIFGLGYIFIEPTFEVVSIDGQKQVITFLFDKKQFTYESGLGKTFTTTSRGYKIVIKDDVTTLGSIALTGSIKVVISQSGKELTSYEIKPSEHGFYLWNWKKTI